VTPVSAEVLRALAHRVARLTVDRKDAERFFIDRDLIRADLSRLARRVELTQTRESEP
jgi:hypothetical protein